MNHNYSSFSQTKGLMWTDKFDAILNRSLSAPVGAVIDLVDCCNLNCSWCNARYYRSNNMLETQHVYDILDSLSDWKVRSVCFAGGGEPALHKDFADIIKYAKELCLEVGISTNGTMLTPEMIDSISANTRFCGFSVDAGTSTTWSKIKSSPIKSWNNLIRNSVMLGEQSDTLDFTFKFMITPMNQNELERACLLAKNLGFRNFYARPASFENVEGLGNYEFDIELIEYQIDRCKEMEDSSFNVYTSFNRVDDNMRKKCMFDKCRATPLIAVYCADGYCYMCIDSREKETMRMCKHEELKDYWNSKQHWDMIDSIDIDKCPRCAFGNYNEQISAYATDYMFKNFP